MGGGHPQFLGGSWLTTAGNRYSVTVFGDAPCLGALVDRFAQRCHVLDIDADSWREKERLERKGRTMRPKR
jgi:hypothetical protein